MKSGLLLAMIMATTGVYAADVDLSEDTTSPVSSVEGLRSLLRKSQRRFFMPSIPSADQILWDVRSDEDIFVDWAGFKPSEKKSAFAILDLNLIPRYEIRLWEIPAGTPGAGTIIIENMYGETMATLRPEKGFDSLGWALDYFGTSDLTDFQSAIHASWHTALSLTLTPYSFAEVCADIREEEQALAMQSMVLFEPMAMMAMGSGVELQMDIARLSNGTVEIFVEWLSSLNSDSLDLFFATDLATADWQLQTNFPTASSTNFYFSDSNTNQATRFYVTGTMHDEDFDGLTSAKERYIYKLREDLWDTSGDGLGDGWLVQYGFNPLFLNTLGDADNDGYGNLEEQLLGSDPLIPDSGGDTGSVATIRYYYDEDDRLTDFYSGAEVAQKTILTASHNISEEVLAK